MRLMFLLIKILPLAFFAQLSGLQVVGHVNDFAKIYSVSYCKALEKRLSSLEGLEVAVVTLSSLKGRPVEVVAREIFDDWKIGEKGKDNGLLLLIGMKERELRIEVGYGLEGVLPDGVCGRVIRNDLSPLFAKKRYEQGTSKALDELIARAQGEYQLEDGLTDIEIFRMAMVFLVLSLTSAFLWIKFRRFFPVGKGRGFPGSFGGFPPSRGGGGFGGFGGGSGGGGGASGRF